VLAHERVAFDDEEGYLEIDARDEEDAVAAKTKPA
jgi:hypothetical protein